jgi:plastocyanin
MAVRRAAVAWAATLIVACGLLALPLVAFAATSAVNIQNSAFAPTSVTVKVGDTITWTNRDAFSHTSTSDTGAWDTGVIIAGASRSVTFTSAGTFAYHCSIHSFMKATVIVQGVSTPQPTPPPTPLPTAPPTPVRTAPPTIVPTVPPTVAPTEAPTAAPTTAAPSPTASATTAAADTPTASASPSAVAVQVTPAPVPGAGPGPLLFAAAAVAVVALGAVAFYLVRRS